MFLLLLFAFLSVAMAQLFGISHMGYIYLLVTLVSLFLFLTAHSPLPLRVFYLWVGISYGVVTLGYLGLLGVTEKIVGKSAKGSLPLLSSLFFLPWLLPVNIYWKISCIYHDSFENTCDLVHPGGEGERKRHKHFTPAPA